MIKSYRSSSIISWKGNVNVKTKADDNNSDFNDNKFLGRDII